MKILVPVDASNAALVPIAHLADTKTKAEVLVLNVQPKFPQHVARFTSRAARDALRAERSSAAMARAIEALSLAGVPFRALSEAGAPAERIAAVAEREGVDEIMMGVGRHPAWLRWLNPSIAQGVMARTDVPLTLFARGHSGAFERFALPAGVAGLAALLLTAE
jgi:nucleotide-binding universal stress UspA family protein